jgi:uncharacterized protein with NAD-binding domain and iron-sulfur cluster
MAEGKPRVAILGGGVGAMTAAYYLSGPGWRDRFESITVFQLGWRLGGKGASGRGANARIEEHGLHVWFGFYENAFRLLSGCYEELGRPSTAPLADIEHAFEPASLFVVMEERPEGWTPWAASVPTNELHPWDPGPRRLPTASEYLKLALVGARDAIRAGIARHHSVPGLVLAPVDDATIAPVLRIRPLPASFGWSEMIRRSSRVWGRLRPQLLLVVQLFLAAAVALAEWLDADPSRHRRLQHRGLLRLVDGAARTLQRHMEHAESSSDVNRRSLLVADLLLSCVRGALRDGLVGHPSGFDAIDHLDFRRWLLRSGARPETVRSGFVKAIAYDSVFAYRDGVPSAPAISAATALRGLARLFFTYRGAVAWKMQAGMGDVVFGPLFDVLQERGVRFEFFHRVDAVRLSEDGKRVASIEIGVQADVLDQAKGYCPLVDIGGLPCWPAEPDISQLRIEGEPPSAADFESFWSTRPDARSIVLHDGVDFDIAVLGISLGALPFLCGDLIARDERWARMVEGIPTIQTEAFQLWLRTDLDELGCSWREGTVSGYVEPFDTYADMSHLIEREAWSGEVRGIAYFCSAMRTPPGAVPRGDPTYPESQARTVYEAAQRFLDRDAPSLWPRGCHRYPAGFRWEHLADPSGASGTDRLRSQFFRANIDPSERYVLSVPGSAKLRLHPGDSGFENLFLAGDWTENGLNVGCVEAAVTSGMLAANAICGVPALTEIVGHDHP